MNLTAEEIAKRVIPTHYTTEDAKAETLQAIAPPEDAKSGVGTDNPRSQNPYTFAFDWVDSRGKRWLGSFTTHYPTPLDLLRAGAMRARLAGGAAQAALDELTDEIAFLVSRLTFCLDERPDWFADPLNIVDGVPLIQAVFAEVLSFEVYFRANGTIASTGAKKSGKSS